MKPGAIHSNEFDAKLDVGTIEKVKFLWNNHMINPSFPKVGAAKITVQKGAERTEYVSSLAECPGMCAQDLCVGIPFLGQIEKKSLERGWRKHRWDHS